MESTTTQCGTKPTATSSPTENASSSMSLCGLSLKGPELKRYNDIKEDAKSEHISPDDAILALFGAMLSFSRDSLAEVPKQTHKVHNLHRRAGTAIRALIKGLNDLEEAWEIGEDTALWADAPFDNHNVPLSMLAGKFGCRPAKLRDMLFGTQDNNLIMGLLGQEHDCPMCGARVTETSTAR